jgi:hypothetical protein
VENNTTKEFYMKTRNLVLAGLIAVLVLVFITCGDSGSSDPFTPPGGNSTPVLGDYHISGLTRFTNGIDQAVIITAKNGKSPGAISSYYDGSTAVPTEPGSYAVTFDVAESPPWNAAVDLSAGTYVIKTATPYTITGSGTSFTAVHGGATVGTANVGIQTVIGAIRDNAKGEDCVIQFGDGTSTLDIGLNYVDLSGKQWGEIELWGKIKSANKEEVMSRTVFVYDDVSICSKADISNTAADGSALHNQGALNIYGGTIEVTSGRAIGSFGITNIFGGTIRTTSGEAIQCSNGPFNISGGVIEATTGYAVLFDSGKMTVSGTALLSSANTYPSNGTVNIQTTKKTSLEILAVL